jgi:hypothetical protein
MLSNERQTALMTGIGKRRARAFNVGFIVAWPLSFAGLLLGFDPTQYIVD